jgi:hypothetical protein
VNVVGERRGHTARLDRDDVVAMLASFGSQPVEGVSDRIDSMELAWLLHQVEQRYGVRIELDDGQVGRMDTVSGAVDVLREAIAAQDRQ